EPRARRGPRRALDAPPASASERARIDQTPSHALIRLEAVTKSFERLVLRGVDLHVPEGCLYGLIGPGGAGKSVIVKLVAGLVMPDGGAVTVAGKEVGAMSPPELREHRRRIGMVFQNNALFDFMTVGD